MEKRQVPAGMWWRYALFLLLSFGVVILNVWLMSIFNPPEKKPAGEGVAQGPAEPGPEEPEPDEPGAPDQAELTAPEEHPPSDRPAPPGGQDLEKPPAEPAPAEPEPEPEPVPDQWVTLGSADPASPYRMLVTLTNRGAAVARIELSSPRYRELEDRSGHMGHVVMDTDVGGRGCPVQVVGEGTPAAAAGIQPGDRILSVNGAKVAGFLSLKRALAETKPGQKVDVEVLRGEKTRTLPVTLGRRPLEVIRPELNDPLSFLFSLHQIDGDVVKLPDESELDKAAKEAEKNKNKDQENVPSERPDWISLELPGLDLREGNWDLVEHTQAEAVFRRELPGRGLEVRKTYRLAEVTTEGHDDPLDPSYHLELSVEIRNTSDAAHKVAYQLDGPTGLPTEGYWYARKVGRGWGAVGIRDVVVSFDREVPKLIGAPSIARGKANHVWQPVLAQGTPPEKLITFIGVDAQYFSVVMIPQKSDERDVWIAQSRPIRVGPVDEKWVNLTDTSCRLVSQTHTLAPGQSLEQTYQVFAGPKKPDLLAQYGLKDMVIYGWFWWVAIPMLKVLHFFHQYVVFNYGLAIIMLTVLVRLCMYPISRKQVLNAQKMQELQPEIKRIAEKYKSNLEARTKAQQELFKKHKFHPMSGCLPMFLQLPIFIGLYRSLMVDVELRQAPLISEAIRWCSNLAAPDMLYDWSWFMPAFVTSAQGILGLGPYFNLLPILTIILFLVQQKMFMPPAADEQAAVQQKVMTFMMLFIGLMFFKVASGLCLYFIASSLWGVAERKLLPKRQAAAQAAEDAEAKPRPARERPARQPSGRAGSDGAAARKKKGKKSKGRR